MKIYLIATFKELEAANDELISDDYSTSHNHISTRFGNSSEHEIIEVLNLLNVGQAGQTEVWANAKTFLLARNLGWCSTGSKEMHRLQYYWWEVKNR